MIYSEIWLFTIFFRQLVCVHHVTAEQQNSITFTLISNFMNILFFLPFFIFKAVIITDN